LRHPASTFLSSSFYLRTLPNQPTAPKARPHQTHPPNLAREAREVGGRWCYHMKRNPIRPVRGARIAVGCWNAEPVLKLMVSAA